MLTNSGNLKNKNKNKFQTCQTKTRPKEPVQAWDMGSEILAVCPWESYFTSLSFVVWFTSQSKSM